MKNVFKSTLELGANNHLLVFFRHRIKLLASVIAFASIATSCGESNVGTNERSNEQDLEVDTTVQAADSTNSIDSIWVDTNCLSVIFIERLESGWESASQNSRLAKSGFTKRSSRLLENGEEFVFVNSTLENKITLLKSKFFDGEIVFKVDYVIKQEQVECFKSTLINKGYKKSDSGEFYKKKGLGTYEEKTINIMPDGCTITYIHQIGKELSMPGPDLVRSNLELLE